MNNIIFALRLTLFAGLSTGIGSALAFYTKQINKKFLSGLSEPLGAIIGYFLLMRFFYDRMFGVIFAIIDGIMVYISLDELLPTAEKYGEHHTAIYGLITGIGVMAIALLLLA